MSCTAPSSNDDTYLEDADPASITWVSPTLDEQLVAGDFVMLTVSTANTDAHRVDFAVDGVVVDTCNGDDPLDDCREDSLYTSATTFASAGSHTLTASFQTAAGRTVTASRTVTVLPEGTSAPVDPPASGMEPDPVMSMMTDPTTGEPIYSDIPTEQSPEASPEDPGTDVLEPGESGEIQPEQTEDRAQLNPNGRGYLDRNRGWHNMFNGRQWAVRGQRILVHHGRLMGDVDDVARCMDRYGQHVRAFADLNYISRASIVSLMLAETGCVNARPRAGAARGGPIGLRSAVCHQLEPTLSRAQCLTRMHDAPESGIEMATRYLASASMRHTHHNDPIKLAVVFHTGSIRRSRANPWHAVSRAGFITEFAQAYNAYRTWEAFGNPTPAEIAARAASCGHDAGARATHTIGLSEAARAAIPLRHLIVYINENRSFDHYVGHLSTGAHGRDDIDGIPPAYFNLNAAGGQVTPAHASTTCIAPDVPHGWNPMRQAWDNGLMDGFYSVARDAGGNPERALFWYDERDLPFYSWLYDTFSISDRYFSSVLGPTWPNRDYYYAATSDGVKNTGDRVIHNRTIFDLMSDHNVSWRIYHAGSSREDCIGMANSNPHIHSGDELFADLNRNDLPDVAFIDGPSEHPPSDIQDSERFGRRLYEALIDSPAWPRTALVMTYDEGGGFFDHVSPPGTCRPDGTLANSDFTRAGPRVPLVVISPYSRPSHVSHRRHESASVTRLIEALHGLPSLTRRDANVNALLDLFDFTHPAMLHPPHAPAAGNGGCNR